jgi:hypothetical protein
MDRKPDRSPYPFCQSRRPLLLAFSAILVGGTLYVFIRPAHSIFFEWLTLIGFGDLLESLRQHSMTLTPLLPKWVYYSLPQGLWAFAYALIIAGIWKYQRTWISYLWLSTIPLLVIGFEGLQYAGVVRGTYCLQDLLFGMGGIVLGAILIYDKQWSLLIKKN